MDGSTPQKNMAIFPGFDQMSTSDSDFDRALDNFEVDRALVHLGQPEIVGGFKKYDISNKSTFLKPPIIH